MYQKAEKSSHFTLRDSIYTMKRRKNELSNCPNFQSIPKVDFLLRMSSNEMTTGKPIHCVILPVQSFNSQLWIVHTREMKNIFNCLAYEEQVYWDLGVHLGRLPTS